MAVGAPIPIFFIGVYGIAVRTRTFLWSIGVYESGATVSYPQATKPKDPDSQRFVVPGTGAE